MSTNVNKKSVVSLRFHVVYAWNKRVSRYLRVGACYCYFSNFHPVNWLLASSESFRSLLLKNDFVLNSAVSLPCSVWFGYSVGDDILF